MYQTTTVGPYQCGRFKDCDCATFCSGPTEEDGLINGVVMKPCSTIFTEICKGWLTGYDLLACPLDSIEAQIVRVF